MIYLDNAATTRIHPDVLDAMLPYLQDSYGNPGALYSFGARAADAVAKAREQVAGLFHCDSEHVVFTSGGSEANNLAIKGASAYLSDCGKKHILISAGEHDSCRRAAHLLGRYGFEVEEVPLDTYGSVDTVSLVQRVRPETGLISVMYINNETGADNPVGSIGEFCRERGILFHTDCVQAAGKCPLDMDTLQCDFASISSHKINGPKGVGALYVRDKGTLRPLISGGSDQEFGLRGGTENVPGIVGFGAACSMCSETWHDECVLRDIFYAKLSDNLNSRGHKGILHVNGAPAFYPGTILNIRFDGVDAETLVLCLDAAGVCVSAGSACRSHESEPSHVLTAMGLSAEKARNSIRLSFAYDTTLKDVLDAASIIADSVEVLLGEGGLA